MAEPALKDEFAAEGQVSPEIKQVITPATKRPPIRTQSADGIVHEFPAETPPEAVDKAMKNYAQEHRNKTTTMGQIGTGLMDPIEGGGQLISNVLPQAATSKLDQFNNWLAKYSGGLIRELPEGGKNQQMAEREHGIEAERGIDKNRIDWSRMAGNVLNPVNYIGVTKGAGLANNLLRATATGGGIAALAPVSDPNYWTKKGEQVAIGSLFGLGVGAAGAAVSKGVSKLGEYIVRNNPEVLENAAVRKILKRITQDQKAGSPSATDAIELINESSKPIVLADVGGENVKALAGNVARKPGESRNVAQQFLTQRDEAAAQRLSADIEQHVHGGQTMFQATEALLQARSAAARPAYDAVHELQGVWSPRLQEFLEDPVVKSGLAKGYELERLQALAEGRPITAKQLGIDLDTEGNAMLREVPNMRVLDMVKQGLDSLVGAERNEITGRLSARGVALDKVRRAYRDELDNLDTSGAYKKARAQWAGYSESLDNVRLGRTILQRSPEENAAATASMSAGDREFYRMGVADLLKERLGRAELLSGPSGNAEAKALVKNSWMRDQLRPAFKSSEEFDKFVEAVTTESKMSQTRSTVLGGAQTAARLAEDAGSDMAEKGVGLVADLARGHLWKSAVTTWKMYRDLGLKPNPEMNEKIAKILFMADLPADSRIAQKLTGALPSGTLNPLESTAEGISASSVGGAGTLAGTQGARDRKRIEITPSARPPSGGFDPASIGARQAPDGKHYIEDPNRPGKYLRVEQ